MATPATVSVLENVALPVTAIVFEKVAAPTTPNVPATLAVDCRLAAPDTFNVFDRVVAPVTASVFAKVTAPLIVRVPGDLTEAIENVAFVVLLPKLIVDVFAIRPLAAPMVPIVYEVALTLPGEYTPELLPTTPPTDRAIVFSVEVPTVTLLGVIVVEDKELATDNCVALYLLLAVVLPI